MDLVEKGDGMKQLLLSELIAGEVRAQRSLRVLEHQEKRLTTLENGLQNQSTNLHDLQEYHSDLLEVRQRQQEVQDLQRELIKLQEIQYLTKISSLEEANEKENESSANTVRDTQVKPSPLPVSVEKSPPTQGGSGAVRREATKFTFQSFPAQQSKSKSNPPRANLVKVNAYKKANNNLQRSNENDGKKQVGRDGPVLNNEDMSYFATKLKRNLSTESLGKGESEETGESQKTANIPFGRFESLKKSVITRSGHCEKREGQDISLQITILRERLSSHRTAIDSLSTEILDLRKERIDLLKYLKNILDWKDRVEFSLENVGIHLNPNEVSEEDENNNSKALAPSTSIASERKITGQERQMNLSVSPCVLSDSRRNGETIPRRKVGIGNLKSLTVEHSKLGERASQMWDLANRFFTPPQAHYILTAPIPFGELDSSGEDV